MSQTWQSLPSNTPTHQSNVKISNNGFRWISNFKVNLKVAEYLTPGCDLILAECLAWYCYLRALCFVLFETWQYTARAHSSCQRHSEASHCESTPDQISPLPYLCYVSTRLNETQTLPQQPPSFNCRSEPKGCPRNRELKWQYWSRKTSTICGS